MHAPPLVLLLAACLVCFVSTAAARTTEEELVDMITKVDPAPILDFSRDSLLARILIPRQPGTENSTLVREAIIEKLQSTGNKWHIETPSFIADTPLGKKNMTNIIATRDPGAARHLVLAAHYDSKYYSEKSGMSQFVGATDSAVPCAMLVDTALALDGLLDAYTQSKQASRVGHAGMADDISLQLVFFDGEEAYETWTATDSVYGARNLAHAWSNTWLTDSYHGGAVPMRQIDMIDHLVLLDLIGAKEPKIASYYESTRWVYDMLKRAEDKLRTVARIAPAGKSAPPQIFTGDAGITQISDDHLPFIERGVPIVHVIPWPFPSVWHKIQDDVSALDYDTIYAFAQIVRLFTAEYLGL
ncbi:glutaminyl-peptide cyclotransferase [Malassezia cuniculi]|uniref:Peptide hydrolase n=1 Tax=Malassezia cuniculi TaxID=948313 RepID=A0AAF0EWV6_9BASI|nr:glutaminyl-peptide cyclotransferase [Malassezia cuniculi]